MPQSFLPTTIPSARQCAVLMLEAVLDQKRPLDEAMTRAPEIGQLSDRDRHFVYLLVMTALRRLGPVDAILEQCLASPLKGRSKRVLHCLRLGVVQLLWLETPPHAAVHSMVETVEALGFAPMKGLMNAVLKRVAREGQGFLATCDVARLSLPGWLFALWSEAYSEETVRRILAASLATPPLDLRPKADAERLAERLGGERLPGGTVRLPAPRPVETIPGFAEGEWWVQDWAASMPVMLLGDVRGLKILDACAAPGGKTAQLAAQGAVVTALDLSERRLATLEANLARLQLRATCVTADLLRWTPEEKFDAILLDAPCSATGTIRRHPEVVWRVTQADIAELARLQQRMLRRACRWLAPGGKMVYSVCSLQPQEGEAQLAAFVKEHPGFTVLTSAMPAPFEADAQGGIRTHPAVWEGGMDGFYAFGLQRLND